MIGGKNQGTQRPSALGSMLQAATYGMTIPNIIGTTRTALLAIWAANFRQGKCHGKKKKSGSLFAPPQYIENIDFLIGSNPIANVLQLWYNSGLAHLNFVTYTPPGSLFVQASITIPDPHFYAVVGVTWTPSSFTHAGVYPYAFDDYGGTGPASGDTTGQAIPLWNSAFAGPDVTYEYGQRFYGAFTMGGSLFKRLLDSNGNLSGCFSMPYRWLPSYGPTVYFDENLNGNPYLYTSDGLTIYYAQTSATIQHQTPIADNCLEWEQQLGSGSAYDNFEAQRIIYPQYAGLSSPNLDLGASGAMPSIRAEIQGSYSFYPRGDADFVDMAADTIKSGLVQLGGSLDGGIIPAAGSASYVQRGVNLSDYPGVIQMKTYVQLDASPGTLIFDFPVTAGNFLVVFASGRTSILGPPLVISDTLGNTWMPLYNGAAGTDHSVAVWYCQANATGNDAVTVDAHFDEVVQAFEVGGLDTFDGFAYFSSVSSKTSSGQVAATNADGTPGYALAFTFTENTLPMTRTDVHWQDLFNGFVARPTPAVAIFYDTSQRRLYYHPGTISISNDFAGPVQWQLFLLTFKNSQPVPYTKSLGNIIDEPSFELTRAACRTNGLWGSVTMDSQRKASDWCKDFATCGIWEYVWNGATLDFVPRSEVSATANGAIYVSPTSYGPVMDLTIDDLIGDSKTPCITVERKPQVDLPKMLQAEVVDRNSNYDQLTISWPEASSVAVYGPRKQSPQSLHMIADPLVATKVLAVQARHNAAIATLNYKFKGKAYLCILKPMAFVTLTEPLLGFNKLPVRITSASENEDFEIDFEAEPFVYGAHSPDVLTATGAAPNVIQLGGDPGSVNTPIIFEAVPRLTAASVPQIWISVSGASPNYGGAIVNISTDGGASYNPVSSTQASSAWPIAPMIFGNALMGVTTGDWPAATDPDTTNDLPVDLTESLGQLPSFNAADRDNFTNPFYVEGGTECIPYELGAYNDALLTATNMYTLKALGAGNELRRCVFNAPVPVAGVDHPLGSAFTLLPASGQGIAKISVDPSWIGKTLFFKFQAFNTFQSNVQQLSACTPYSYAVTGCPSGGNNPGTYTLQGGTLTQPCATPTEVDMTAATATFVANSAIYNARTFTIPTVTAPTLFYVTIYDPAMLGDTNTSTPAFSDDFSGGTLDASKWQANSWTIANYAGAGSTDTSDPANCDLSGGSMRLTLTQPSAGAATGCEIQSLNQFGYGTYEWSLRASSTSATSGGAGAAVSGQISTGFIISDPTSKTEIDCPEIEGRTPTIVEFTNWLNGANTGASSITAGFNPQDGFHRYKMVWSAASVLYYIDDVLVVTHTTDVPLAINPAYILISHYGTNSNTFGGLATVGTTRYLYCNSFKYWATGATTNLPSFIETSSAKATAPGYIFIGTILALPGGCGTGGGTMPGMGLQPVAAIPLAPGAAGNFTVPHGLGVTPTFVLIEMTAGSLIWSQTPTRFDATNLYLVSADPAAAGIAYVFIDAPDTEIALTPSAGNFTVAHGLSASPFMALVEMTSGGLIQFQDPPWDATNVYLTASDSGLTGQLQVMLTKPASTIPFSRIPLTPGAAGNFTVPHGLSTAPRYVVIRMNFGGLIWQQSPVGFDATNLYLVASDAGVTGEAEVWP